MEDRELLDYFKANNSYEKYIKLLKFKSNSLVRSKVKKEYLRQVKCGKTDIPFKKFLKTAEYKRIYQQYAANNKNIILLKDVVANSNILHEMYEEYCMNNYKKEEKPAKSIEKEKQKYKGRIANLYSESGKDINHILNEAVKLFVDELTLDDMLVVSMEMLNRYLEKMGMNEAFTAAFNEWVRENGYNDLIDYVINKKFGINNYDEFIYAYIENKKGEMILKSGNLEYEERIALISDALCNSRRKNKKGLTLLFSEMLRISAVIKQYKKQYQEYQVKSIMLLKGSIPEKMCDMYPLARSMSRHFVLHVGPTNSGKTYDSIEKLKKCKKGVYLAPLRLLAYEIYDKLNDTGVICDMLTGEEAIEFPDSTHLACTIEMLDEYEEYELAIIDEGQNVAEVQRGGAWTKAILGVRAKEVHICSDDSCVDLIIKMINQCGDSYELIRHERMTEISLDKSFTRFPEDVKDKDALIVFSKKSVMAVASDLQKRGVPVSILYGNLPYDVRLNEVKRFTNGETKAIVATDAIGMGVNLPIKRVVFLETKKFDGISVRPLRPTEIKQIAGRAGRRGLYKKGLYTAEFGKHFIDSAMKEALPLVDRARVNFPESLVKLDMPLSALLRKWYEIPDEDIYVKSILEEDLALCEELEKFIEDKQLIYRCITIAFDSKNKKLHKIFVDLSKAQNLDYDSCKENIRNIVDANSVVFEEEMDKLSLDELGELYSVYDLLYAFLRKFEHNEYLEVIMDLKKDCSNKMMHILQTEELVGKTCIECGAPLKWNYPYRQCQKCFEKKNYP